MMSASKVILPFKDADVEGIGNKARHLSRLMQCNPSLFIVPNGLVLLPDFSAQTHGDALLHMLPSIGDGPFAVRSCGLNEDGASESMAGQFDTELNVGKDGLMAAIASVRKSFADTLDTSAVLVQQMIQPDYAGVLFSRSPENFGLSSCEYTHGMADAVVSGRVEPKRVDYGRWTGNVYPAQDDVELEEMLSLLFLVGLTIEEKMGCPQDIEWAYDVEKKQLYILQSRGITSELYDASVACEQERVANIALQGKLADKGLPVFENSAVREVVTSPTRLTRSLMEQLYAPTGSLGKALALLGLPCPALTEPYITSVFGQLYANVDVERQLFGLSLKRLWANDKLKRKLRKQPQVLLAWLAQAIENFPEFPQITDGADQDAKRFGAAIMQGFQTFTQDVYPIAYAATMLAQMADEDDSQGSLTSQLMSDLSKLHHTGDVESFIEVWGLRSANDYELSAPRFCETKQGCITYAENYANMPWGSVDMGDGFIHFKELAKHKAVCWLYPLRQHLLGFAQALGLSEDLVFYLDFKEIEAFVQGKLSEQDLRDMAEQHQGEVAQFAHIQLGDEISLETIERLQNTGAIAQGMHGKMVSVRKAFQGVARHVDGIKDKPLEGGEVLLTKHLTPELVGLFPQSVGCIADMGGALSHAAIVAREHGYPIVVLASSSEIIHDGDEVAVSEDGALSMLKKSV